VTRKRAGAKDEDGIGIEPTKGGDLTTGTNSKALVPRGQKTTGGKILMRPVDPVIG
jgi:hypothetical protein